MCVKFTTGIEVLQRNRLVFKVVREHRSEFRSMYQPECRSMQTSRGPGVDVVYKIGEMKTAPFERTAGFYTYSNLHSLRQNARRALRYSRCIGGGYKCLLCRVPKGTRIQWGSTNYDQPFDRRYSVVNVEMLLPLRVLPDFNYEFYWGRLNLS